MARSLDPFEREAGRALFLAGPRSTRYLGEALKIRTEFVRDGSPSQTTPFKANGPA